MFRLKPFSKGSKEKIEIFHSSLEKIDGKKALQFKETRCRCCGTLLRHPFDEIKFKCTVCDVTTVLVDNHCSGPEKKCVELSTLMAITVECQQAFSERNSDAEHKYLYFLSIEEYMIEHFKCAYEVNKSFERKHKNQMIDYEKSAQFYRIIGSLPTKRPLYVLLHLLEQLLKRPKTKISNFTDFTFIFFIMESPCLRQCLTDGSQFSSNPKMKKLSYNILKKCIGYLGCMESATKQEYTSFLVRVPPTKFTRELETFNIYLTHQFQKIGPGKPSYRKLDTKSITIEHSPQEEEKCRSISYLFHPGRQKIPEESRYRIEKYGINWHIKTVMEVMSMYFSANCRKSKCSYTYFYNTLVDFIDYKKDFLIWTKINMKYLDETPTDLLVRAHEIKYIAISQYPFLLSLGIKIAMMEFETSRMMEHNAEQAFLKALDTKRLCEVHFKVRVRRDHVTQDSIACIQNHPQDLKKSLRVEFVNEPGIDAGGLKKEWFLLLTRELFHPGHGLFQNIPESRLCWFTLGSSGLELHGESTYELYYLFGVVVGLAMYNGTILDLRFGRVLYKKLCGEKVGFEDYQELYPETARNLLKLYDYNDPDFTEVFDLYFETTYSDVATDKKITKPLCPEGSQLPVTLGNRTSFIEHWIDFYLNKEVETTFNAFKNGFKRVIGDSLTFLMFTSEEVERVICGSVQQEMDFSQLRTVTKYHGGFCDSSTVVQWLWQLLPSLSQKRQQKFLHFVTGSDRIPVTGLTNLPFKITRITMGSSSQLPTSHTCFNELCLYEYTSREQLSEKLIMALDMYEGYGFK